MTKESVKKTEVIEKTVSESFTVCDSCGMETEHAAEFTSRGDSMTLHFCKSCLDKDELIIQGRDIEEDQSSIGAIILGGMLSASVVGFVGLGLLARFLEL